MISTFKLSSVEKESPLFNMLSLIKYKLCSKFIKEFQELDLLRVCEMSKLVTFQRSQLFANIFQLLREEILIILCNTNLLFIQNYIYFPRTFSTKNHWFIGISFKYICIYYKHIASLSSPSVTINRSIISIKSKEL